MPEQDIHNIIQSIPDGQSATIILTDKTGEKKHLQGAFKGAKPPFFFFLFPPEVLPANLDTVSKCPFASRDLSDKDVAFVAEIVSQPNNQTLELMARDTVQAADLRQFFRVTLRTRIIVRFFPDETAEDQRSWEMAGETVDISQSGVLAIFPDECSNSSSLDLEISLVNPVKRVFCTSHVIRSKRLKKDRWLISFHFDEISSTDRDAIAKNCFAEQRRQLRDKGQTF